MNITKKLQLFTYTPNEPVLVSALSDVNSISYILSVDSNGVVIRYTDGIPNFLQQITQLNTNQGYMLSSKSDATLPYEIYASTDDVPESVTINQTLQIGTYCCNSYDLLNPESNVDNCGPPPSITITQQPADATATSPSDWSQLGSDIDGETAGDQSGVSVAISSDGNRVAIGAYGNDGNGLSSGHVRIYDWSGSAWVQAGSDIDGEAAGDYSGASVALSSDGSRVAIGAYNNDGNGSISGHVRIYDWSGTAWVQVGADIDGEAAGEWSGVSVALSSDGSRVAIGAVDATIEGGNGNVRVFDWSGSTWVQVGADIDGEAAGDWSGYSVALSSDGSRVAIGARFNDGNGVGVYAGHVRVYDWSGSAWVQVGADIDGEAAHDRSNHVALSSDGSRVAIGATENDGNGTNAGHVRIYDWSGSAWVQVGADIDGEAAGDFSGASVALSSDGSRVAIGAPANDGSNGTNYGHVRIFDWSGSAWVQVGADIDGEAAGDHSGASVALSSDGGRVAIGAYGNDGNGTDSGHVRTYELLTAPFATFSVSATSNDGSVLTYQWEAEVASEWLEITGQTTNTLTLTGLTADDNGNRYRVVVDSATAAAVTSNLATLTVNN